MYNKIDLLIIINNFVEDQYYPKYTALHDTTHRYELTRRHSDAQSDHGKFESQFIIKRDTH